MRRRSQLMTGAYGLLANVLVFFCGVRQCAQRRPDHRECSELYREQALSGTHCIQREMSAAPWAESGRAGGSCATRSSLSEAVDER